MPASTAKRYGDRRTINARQNHEGGFTLIETTIALAMMLFSLLALVSLFMYAARYNSGAQDRTIAIALAQQRMEKLRKSPFSEVVTSTESDVMSGGRHFEVAVEVVDAGTMKNIRVQVTPKSTGPGWVRTPVTLLSQRAAKSLGPYF